MTIIFKDEMYILCKRIKFWIFTYYKEIERSRDLHYLENLFTKRQNKN